MTAAEDAHRVRIGRSAAVERNGDERPSEIGR